MLTFERMIKLPRRSKEWVQRAGYDDCKRLDKLTRRARKL